MVKNLKENVALDLKTMMIIRDSLISDLFFVSTQSQLFKTYKNAVLLLDDKIIKLTHNQCCSNLIEYQYGLNFISCELANELTIDEDLIYRYRVYHRNELKEVLHTLTSVKISKNSNGEFDYNIV